MKNFAGIKYYYWLILISVPVISVILTPSVSTDPTNVPKMLILVPTASALLLMFATNIKLLMQFTNKVYLVLLSLFILQSLIAVIFSGAPITQQIYGVFGRNTGLLTLCSFAIISIASSYVVTYRFLKGLLITIMVSAALNEAYCLLQAFGLDPIKWDNPYSSVIGFLGNPNFLSSFLGMAGIVAFTYLFSKNSNRFSKLLSTLFIFVAIYLIIKSQSQQGGLVLAAGTSLVVLLYVIGTPKLAIRRIIWPLSSLLVILGTITFFGTLNIGPLSMLYKLSVRQRGYYWDAAISMMKSHPLTGVGLDSFGDWYLVVRSASAATLAPRVVSNNSHNVILEYGAVGGILLMVLYVGAVCLTFASALKYLKRERAFDWVFTAVFVTWIGYTAQSIISINQIGLAIWGWVLMGSIIGIEYKTRKKQPEENSKKNIGTLKLLGISGITFGLFLVVPVFNNDANYRNAISTQNVEILTSSVLKYPEDLTRTFQAAQILAKNNLMDSSEKLIDHVLEINPRFYNAWDLKSILVRNRSGDISNVKEKMQLLNPRVPINL